MIVRSRIVLFLFCISLNAIAQNHIISNQKLISSGINRLSGIYALMNEWDSYTFDGYRYYASANALSTFQNQDWTLMLDGQRMDINFFNLKNINVLPITVNHVNSAETVSHPEIYNGEFTANGSINLKTLKPKNGLSVTGRYSAGNETGDPGPYFYTKHRSSNVEEDGPNLSASLEYGSENIWGRLFFYTESFSATDTSMRKRNPQLGWQDFKGRRFSPSLQLGLRAFNGTHNFFLGYSTSEIQPFHPRTYTSNDLIFFNPAIKDYPVQTVFKHAGLNGNVSITSTSQIYYSIKASSNKLYSALKELDNFDHLQTNYYTNLHYSTTGGINYFLGAGFDYTEFSVSYSSTTKGVSLFKAYGGMDYRLFENLISQTGLEFQISKNSPALKGYLNTQWIQSNKLWVKINAAAIQTLPEEKSDLWHWIENGYDVFKGLNVNYSFKGKRNKEFKITTDLNVNYKMNPSLNFMAGLLYRNFNNYFIEEVMGVYNPDSSFFNSFVKANTNSNGSIAGFSIRFNNKILSTLEQSFQYRFLTSVSGGLSFNNEWETIPNHKLNYNVMFYPFKSFSLWANLTFLSPVKLRYYPKLEELSNGFYKSSLAERFILDFSIRKWFWNNRLRFNLLFKNLLNNELRYHPLGAEFNLSVFFTAEIVFNSIVEW
ncbi:MAG: hypothetical protein KJN64_12090 [Ignavibacteria bacterium]|nr:hypothetical protein [Ignavibacteria bacterium]MBT8383552.1 hypothetical protein [Ignavibacteria bacterium]